MQEFRHTQYAPRPVPEDCTLTTGWICQEYHHVESARGSAVARFRNRFAISFEELCHCSFPLTNTMLELFPWGQVTSERDKSGVTKLSHHAKKFLSQCGKSRPVSTWGQLLAIILFFQASCSFSASPSSLVTKKAATMAGDKRLRQNGMIIALTLYDMK